MLCCSSLDRRWLLLLFYWLGLPRFLLCYLYRSIYFFLSCCFTCEPLRTSPLNSLTSRHGASIIHSHPRYKRSSDICISSSQGNLSDSSHSSQREHAKLKPRKLVPVDQRQFTLLWWESGTRQAAYRPILHYYPYFRSEIRHHIMHLRHRVWVRVRSGCQISFEGFYR